MIEIDLENNPIDSAH